MAPIDGPNYQKLQQALKNCIQVTIQHGLYIYKKRGFHAHGVYHTQYASCMGTVRVKQEKEADTE